jgi:hypothetical protein
MIARRACALAAVLALSLASPVQAGALVQKVTAPDDELQTGFGQSMAIEGDTAVVGAPYTYQSRGMVYVFNRQADSWVLTGELSASDAAVNDELGFSVAIDGDTIVAGALDGQGTGAEQGAVYTFARTGPPERNETAKLTASDGADYDELGWSVAIDGGTIVAGAPGRKVGSNANQGSVYTFARTGGAARQESGQLTASDGAAQDLLGASLAIDGDTIVAGAPTLYDDPNPRVGAAYTFATTGDAARTETAKLVPVLGGGGDAVGSSVAIAGDTIAVGAPFRDVLGRADQGTVYTFARAGDANRVQTGTLAASDGDGSDLLGESLAIDGDTIHAGALGDDVGSNNVQGSVYEFAVTGAPGRTETGKLTDPDGAAEDAFGATVAADAGVVVVGATGDDVGHGQNRGSASMFYKPGPPGDSGGAGPGDTGPGADVTAPVLIRLRVTPARLRRSARVSYVLSEPATVRFTLRRAIRRRGHTRYVPMRGSFTRAGRLGANSFRFTGRIGHRALRAGRYRLVATATDTAGNSAAPRAVRFRRERLFRPSSRH